MTTASMGGTEGERETEEERRESHDDDSVVTTRRCEDVMTRCE